MRARLFFNDMFVNNDTNNIFQWRVASRRSIQKRKPSNARGAGGAAKRVAKRPRPQGRAPQVPTAEPSRPEG